MDETRARIVQAIEDAVRSMAFLYTSVHIEGYRAGVEFGKQNAQFYVIAEQFQQRSPQRKVEVQVRDRVPLMVVDGGSID